MALSHIPDRSRRGQSSRCNESQIYTDTASNAVANVVINSIDATLKDREITFNRVGMSIASDVLFYGVVDRGVVRESRSDLGIDWALIGAKICFLGGSINEDRFQRLGSDFRNVARPHFSTKFH